MEVAVFQKPETDVEVQGADINVGTDLDTMIAVYFGFDTQLTVDVAHSAIESLVYSGPEAIREAAAQSGFTFGGGK